MLTAENINDCTRFADVMAGIRFQGHGPGRPRTRPDRVIADKGYSSRAIRGYLKRRGIPATIPERADQQANRKRTGRTGGRPPTFDPSIYTRRNVVERCFQHLKHYRAIATRYDKTAQSYQTVINLASLITWL
ncbi:hypothetical protein GCM10010470_01410 [Saccharopolyspora taberi]|uniref:Transposase DDE domain-containing protein n=1 Tax=Saccharopolyspora taberi TaxID=60895 RepID=A0ABN3V488_9PSEU